MKVEVFHANFVEKCFLVGNTNNIMSRNIQGFIGLTVKCAIEDSMQKVPTPSTWLATSHIAKALMYSCFY